MIIAGITGTIGTGKSTVAAMFGELGAFIIDSDKLAREVVEPGKPAWQAIIDYFGRELLNDDQTLNRQMLADIVFKDQAKLQVLNSIVHPEIFKQDRRLVAERKSINPDSLVIKDIPLLLEMGRDVARLMVDKIIVVYASPDIQLKRLIARGVAQTDALNRINNQIPVTDKMQLADYVINNDGTLDETRAQVMKIYALLMADGSTV
jgi:dephospho-CoA kinase